MGKSGGVVFGHVENMRCTNRRINENRKGKTEDKGSG